MNKMNFDPRLNNIKEQLGAFKNKHFMLLLKPTKRAISEFLFLTRFIITDLE